jgi:hypothetical protein
VDVGEGDLYDLAADISNMLSNPVPAPDTAAAAASSLASSATSTSTSVSDTSSPKHRASLPNSPFFLLHKQKLKRLWRQAGTPIAGSMQPSGRGFDGENVKGGDKESDDEHTGLSRVIEDQGTSVWSSAGTGPGVIKDDCNADDDSAQAKFGRDSTFSKSFLERSNVRLP